MKPIGVEKLEQKDETEAKAMLIHGVRLSFPEQGWGKVNKQIETYKTVIDLQGRSPHQFLDKTISMIADLANCSEKYVRDEIAKLDAEVEINEFIQKLATAKLPNGLPRRLSSDNDHPWYNEDVIRRVGVRFNGAERPNDVCQYDVDAGFIRIHLRDNKGQWKKSRGRYVTYMLKGKVEPFWKDAR
jgi:hypothetical protein